jgi:hypothetical protein
MWDVGKVPGSTTQVTGQVLTRYNFTTEPPRYSEVPAVRHCLAKCTATSVLAVGVNYGPYPPNRQPHPVPSIPPRCSSPSQSPAAPQSPALGPNKPGDPGQGRSTGTFIDRPTSPPAQGSPIILDYIFDFATCPKNLFTTTNTSHDTSQGVFSLPVSTFVIPFLVLLRLVCIAEISAFCLGPDLLRTLTVEHFPSTSLDQTIRSIRNQSS